MQYQEFHKTQIEAIAQEGNKPKSERRRLLVEFREWAKLSSEEKTRLLRFK